MRLSLSPSSATFFLFALTVLFWTPRASSEGTGLTEGPSTSLACNPICQGVNEVAEHSASSSEREQWAACFSCRCKESIGWMPSAEELKCSSGTHLERYRAKTQANPNGALPLVTGLEVIDPEGSDTTGCLNPGMAVAGCDLKSRFKRIVHENAEYQMLCRKRTSAEAGYYEYLIIGTNTRSGATCFWQARDYSFNGEDIPSLDLTDSSRNPIPTAVQKYVDTFGLYSAGPSTCTECHATDAFLWSPYLHSAYPAPLSDPAVRARLAAPYFKVSAASDRLQPVGHRFLQAGPANALPSTPATNLGCADCHRVADRSWCYSFSLQSLGQADSTFAGTYDPTTSFQHARRLLFWMPPSGSTHAGFVSRSAGDLSRIQQCCTSSNASCHWTESF